MGKKIAAFLLTAAMVLALLPMALAASNAADTAEFQFLLSPHAPDGKVVAADLLLRATAVETVNGFQMSFNGSAKLTGAAIEGARTTDASIGGDTIYWFTTAESDYFTVGTEYIKLATLEFSSDTHDAVVRRSMCRSMISFSFKTAHLRRTNPATLPAAEAQSV